MEWISVNEDLPPDGYSKYLVTYRHPSGRLRTSYSIWEEKTTNYRGRKWGWRSRDAVRRKDILYWMPIPPPPHPQRILEGNDALD